MSDRVFISDLRAGDQIHQVYAVRDKMLRERRDGIPFLKLRLFDKTGEVEGLVWDNAVSAHGRIVDAEFVRIQARVELYQRRNNLNISMIEAVPSAEVNARNFLPETPRSRKELWRQVGEYRGLVKNSYLAQLLAAFFDDEVFATAFRDAPAAKRFHHAYLGGLLEHSASVAGLAVGVASQYPDLDQDLLLTGALLHDIGKVKEYTYKTTIGYSDEGRLLGHIVIGDGMVTQRIEAIQDFPEELAQKVRHLLLSHHGELEYGSPVSIRIAEAFVLHFLDNLDAKLNMVRSMSERMGESESRWTPYDSRLGREFFLGERESGPPEI